MESRVVVVPEERLVMVGGIPMRWSFVPVAEHEGARAIQWQGENGFIEMKDGRNVPLDESMYETNVQPYVSQWHARKAREEEESRLRYDSSEARWSRLRDARDRLVEETDYLMLADYPITDACREEFRAYRKVLRDITANPAAPWDGDNIPWPTKPTIVRKEG